LSKAFVINDTDRAIAGTTTQFIGVNTLCLEGNNPTIRLSRGTDAKSLWNGKDFEIRPSEKLWDAEVDIAEWQDKGLLLIERVRDDSGAVTMQRVRLSPCGLMLMELVAADMHRRQHKPGGSQS